MAFTTAQDFIDVWTELDAAYVTYSISGANFGDYTDATLIDTTGNFTNTVSQFGQWSHAFNNASIEQGTLGYAVNQAFVELANEYIAWLEAGNAPIYDIAKDRGGAPAPGQPYHDNIIGNTLDGAITDRFVNANSNPDITGDGNGDVIAEPRSVSAIQYGERPYFSGNNENNLAEVIAWDVANAADEPGMNPDNFTRGAPSVIDGDVLLVSAASNDGVNDVTSFGSIQAAIDAATAGDTIVVGTGTYVENLTINKAIDIIGVGNVSIEPASGTAVFVDTGVNGNVSFDNIDLDGNGAAGIGIDVEHGANVGTFSFTDGDISGFTNRGIWASDDGDPVGTPTFANLVIDTAAFSNNGTGAGNTADIKLFGFSGDASFSNITFTGGTGVLPGSNAGLPDSAVELIGFVNSDSSANPVGANTQDIGTVSFTNVVVTGEYHKNPIAIFNFGESDGLSISGLNLSGASSFWGPVFNLDGFDDTTIDTSMFQIIFPATTDIHTHLQGEKANQGTINTTIIGTDANDLLNGKEGNDILIGGGGTDFFVGGDGIDVAVVGDGGGSPYNPADYDFSSVVVNAGVAVGGFTTPDGAEGLDGIEVIQVANTGSSTFVVLEGMSLQAAVDAASSGDTIVIDEGVHVGDVTIDKGLTILGANQGLAGNDGSRGTESTLDGDWTIATTEAVVINGVQFLNNNGASQSDSLTVNAGANATITNSQFISTVAGGGTGGTHDRAITTQVLGTATLDITNNLFAGDGTFSDGAKYSTAAWGRGIWLNDSDNATVNITGNTFQNTRTAVNLENYSELSTIVSGNTIVDAGSGFSIGLPTGLSTRSITGNQFQDVDTDLNLRNLTTGISVDLTTDNNTGVPGDSTFYSDNGLIPGNNPGDLDDPAGTFTTLLGDGSDFFVGTAGNDRITGDNTSTASGGDDQIDGGAGVDTVVYEGARADYDVSDDGKGNLVVDDLNLADGDDGRDVLIGVEFLQFSDGVVDVASLGDIADVSNFDGDADDDILFNLGGNFIVGNVGAPNVFIGSSDRSALAAGDFDGNGSTDILMELNGSGIHVVENVSAPNTLLGQTDRTARAIGDFDGDDSDEILFTFNSNGGHIVGNVGAPNVYIGGTDRTAQAVGDFDGDGDDDILMKLTAGGAHVIEKFGEANTFVGRSDRSVSAVGDFDGDGDDDLLMELNADGNYVIENIGEANTFVGRSDRTVRAVGDFDGDGSDDILMQLDGSGEYVIEGLGGTPNTFVGAAGRTVRGVGDYDGDGDDDILMEIDGSGEHIVERIGEANIFLGQSDRDVVDLGLLNLGLANEVI